jgi:hypothetical protein
MNLWFPFLAVLVALLLFVATGWSATMALGGLGVPSVAGVASPTVPAVGGYRSARERRIASAFSLLPPGEPSLPS